MAKKMKKKNGMLSSDYSAPYNLPKESMRKMYSKIEYGDNYSYRDDLASIDAQIRADIPKGKKGY